MSIEFPSSSKESSASRQKTWEEKGMQKELDTALAAAKSMSAIGSALFTYSANIMDGMVCGVDGAGEFQSAQWEDLKGTLEKWSQYDYPLGSSEGLNMYVGLVTLLEDFPGATTRRALDKMLRHYCGVERIDGVS